MISLYSTVSSGKIGTTKMQYFVKLSKVGKNKKGCMMKYRERKGRSSIVGVSISAL